MPEMRDPAEIAVFDTCELEWTAANDVLGAAGETIDKVRRWLLRVGRIRRFWWSGQAVIAD